MKQKRKIVLLCGLLAVVAAVFYIDQKGPVFPGTHPPTKPYPPLAVENPSLRRDKLRVSQETAYKSSGRDLFSEVVAAPVRPKPRPEPTPVLPSEPPPPPPPKLPVKFYGYGTIPNGKRAFLTDGDDIYIVGEGDTLLGRYRILRISNANLDFEEISSGMRGTAPLEAEAAPPA